MADIATLPANTVDPYLPFDWQVEACGVSAERFHDYGNPCSAPLHDAGTVMLRALVMDDSLNTAVVLSLFTDARAAGGEPLPLNQTDRRGWCGEEVFAQDGGKTDRWGSLLWLYFVSKQTGDVLEKARFAAWEALQWLVRDGIAARVEVSAQWGEDDVLLIRPTIYQPDELQPVYDVLWRTTITRVPS